MRPSICRQRICRSETPITLPGTVCSSVCQVQGERDLAHYFRPLPDGCWAVPPLGRGMNSYPKIPRAWWRKIAEEYAAGLSGSKLAKKFGVGSTRTIYLVPGTVARHAAWAPCSPTR